MSEKLPIRYWWESAVSSASRNHLNTFCRPFVHCVYLKQLSLFCLLWLSSASAGSHWLHYQFLYHDRTVARAQKKSSC